MKHVDAIFRWGTIEEKTEIVHSLLDKLFSNSLYGIPPEAKSGIRASLANLDTSDGVPVIRGMVAGTMAFVISPSLPYSANGALLDMLFNNSASTSTPQIRAWIEGESSASEIALYHGPSCVKRSLNKSSGS